MKAKAVAVAHSNIALVKYWGKCDVELNLPAVPSLSFTLQAFTTRTEVRFDSTLREDTFFLNDLFTTGKALSRVSRHLDRITHRANNLRAEVRSWNNFPTASGLASSASGFAALTLAAHAAFCEIAPKPFQTSQASLSSELRALSILARQGSGSAARSMFGGLVLLGAGTPFQADSSFATPLCSETEWPELCMVIGIFREAQKPISSTEAMNHTVATSPYYTAFKNQANTDIRQAIFSIQTKDIEQLGTITERSALRMHATAFAADPGIVYFRGTTLEAFHGLRELRHTGIPAWFTCDAGPHPKALTLAQHAKPVAAMLGSIPGVERTVISSLGAGAKLFTELT